MAKFILWVLFAKIVSQVAILKKDCDYWKKEIVIIEKDDDYGKGLG